MRGRACGASRAGEHDRRDVAVRRIEAAGLLPVGEELAERDRRVPFTQPLAGGFGRRRPGLSRALQRAPQRERQLDERVAPGLDATQQTVEGRDVAADRVTAVDVGLDECRAGSAERVVHALPRPEAAAQEHLDQLRDELPEVGVEGVDVLRPLRLRSATSDQLSSRSSERYRASWVRPATHGV